tara:strand:+ start:167 stop:916 length:750 start_codon:yes stop_codon:yes gene_type:complete
MKSIIRLYISQEIVNQEVIYIVEGQLHYLRNVMRVSIGDDILIFDGINGEFRACITNITKKRIVLNVMEKTRVQDTGHDIWIIFPILKKSKINLLIEKTTELGVSCLQPIFTEYTNSDSLKINRLTLSAIEAAEQSRRLSIPVIKPVKKLDELISCWDKDRRLLVMDETTVLGSDKSLVHKTLSKLDFNKRKLIKDAIIIGPEGGFSSSELDLLENLPFVTKLSLGQQLLRAETAAIAALAIWNECVSN